MKLEIKVPEVGESITEGVLIEWYKQSGDVVHKDEALFELETDKITMKVEAAASGRLNIGIDAGTDVEVGQVVGVIDTDADLAAVSKSQGPEAQADLPGSSAQAETDDSIIKIGDLSPAVRRLVEEHSIDPQRLQGSGKGGRIIKSDVLDYIKAANDAAPQAAPATTSSPSSALRSPERSSAKTPVRDEQGHPRQTRRPMSSLRRRVADRLIQAQQNAAILTTFNEVDMSAAMLLRSRYKDMFEKRYGVRLGFMSIFIKAVVDALKAVPALNAHIEGTDIVQNHFFDIGVAVGTDRGLVVPVLREVDKAGFADIEQMIGSAAQKARDGKLEISDLQGGCFTVSNGGVYGSMLSTPILNPPQSGILGMHAIKKRPVIVGPDDRIEVRPMMYLALSYDHRLIDGAEAVTFLKRVVDCVENPERMMLAI